MSPKVQVVQAPSRLDPSQSLHIFLAGTTSATGEPDWRDTLSKALANELGEKDADVTILNPKRDDWDSSWREDSSDKRWAEQIQWELDMQERADIIVVFLHGVTAAPISLAEMGMAAPSGKLIACALNEYIKRGYVEVVCKKYRAPFVKTEEALKDAVLRRLDQLR